MQVYNFLGGRCKIILNKVIVDFGKRPKLTQNMKVILAKKNGLISGDISASDITKDGADIPSAQSADVMKVSLPKVKLFKQLATFL